MSCNADLHCIFHDVQQGNLTMVDHRTDRKGCARWQAVREDLELGNQVGLRHAWHLCRRTRGLQLRQRSMQTIVAAIAAMGVP